MTDTLEFDAVTKQFGAVTALDGVGFSVKQGETIALLGPSGCGKTTILRLIAGFEQPDAGRVLLGGRDMAGLRPYQRNVGLLFQHYALFPHMTVAENIAYGLRYRGTPKAEVAARVTEMLRLVRLEGMADRRPDQLSGGQQQRVALARAMATRPELLLLDEPLSALDARLRQDLRTELRDLLAETGTTAIVVTHDQEEAMSLGQRIFVMRAGRILQQGIPDEVYWQPQDRFTAEFMGRVNWLDGSFVTGAAGPVFRTPGGWEIAVPALPSGQAGATELCLRPESIEMVGADHGIRTDTGTMRGVLEQTTLLGPTRILSVRLSDGQSVEVAMPNRSQAMLQVGSFVMLAVNGHNGAFFGA